MIVKGGPEDGQYVTQYDEVTVHATGWVKKTMTKFWSTKDKSDYGQQQPFKYKAGTGGVIVGWDQGTLGMAVGEVRKLDIPADEVINATLHAFVSNSVL